MSPEILAPAGDERCARAAILSGADALYLGLTAFSARREAANFDAEGLKKLTTYAHLLGVKVYVCLNTLVKESELDAFFQSVGCAWEGGADAILMQDMFLGKALKERFPSLTLHLSTQAGCCNERGAALAKECGFSRVVLARETPLSEIEKIASVIETEVFVQGALCTCFSGQCYFSSFAGNNSGNRGLCKQPCRKKYSIDRQGFETPAYALSLSDLCVGERVRELLDAGVVSLKIEGRMRRPEYVAAAVTYYRALLAGEPAEGAFSDLKRAYNRGDYTHGLAFGQGKDLLSRRVQGHIGERVGNMRDGSFCESGHPAREGDGFKILRGGEEVGGARFAGAGKGGFFLSSREKLLRGDEVRLTTDSALPARLERERTREIVLSLRFVAGEPAEASCGDFRYTGSVLERAKSAPLTRGELERCFEKTDGLPFFVRFGRVETADAFLPKSALNAFRRAFFEELVSRLVPPRTPLGKAELPALSLCKTAMTALISPDLEGLEADILIFKPRDFGNISAEEVAKGRGRKFLFLPPFFTRADEELIREKLSLFDGIYSDGYYGLSLANETRLPFFAGTGWNLSNRGAISEAKRAGVSYFALSKELTSAEQDALSAEGAFALTLGGVKIMDLLYCPFGRTCGKCDKRGQYILTDEEGRKFPLRRYLAGNCRFELYNCAPLRGERTRAGALADLTGQDPSLSSFAACPEAAPLDGATRGHTNRSLL